MYIATFFSYYGAMLFKRYGDNAGWQPKLMAVPRQLSSSCGTCVAFNTVKVDVTTWMDENLELKEELAAVYKVEYKDIAEGEPFDDVDAPNYVLVYSCDHQ